MLWSPVVQLLTKSHFVDPNDPSALHHILYFHDEETTSEVLPGPLLVDAITTHSITLFREQSLIHTLLRCRTLYIKLVTTTDSSVIIQRFFSEDGGERWGVFDSIFEDVKQLQHLDLQLTTAMT